MKKIILMSLMTCLLVYGDNTGGSVLSGKGKFVFGQISEFARAQYMLNTETGELWNIQHDENNISILARINYDCYNLKQSKSAHCTLPVELIEDEVRIRFGKK